MRPVSLAMVVMAVLLTGCLSSRELASLQREIDRSNPGIELRRSFVLNLGPGTLHLLERASNVWEPEEAVDLSQYLRDIDRIKVGIYDVRQRSRGAAEAEAYRFQLPDRDGWTPAVVVREQHDATSVYFRETGRSVRDILVVNASSDQLVIVRLEGNLGRLLLRAMDERGRIMGRSAQLRSLETMIDP